MLTNTVYEVKIRTENSEGPGPTSPSIFGLSGQSPPREPPTDITVVGMNSSSVELKWVAYVPPLPATVDGYWVCSAILVCVT